MEFECSNWLNNSKLYKLKSYDILYDNGKWNCTCRGYKMKKHCKHITHCQKTMFFENEKIELQNGINALMQEFGRNYPEVKKILFEDGQILLLI